MRHRPGRWGRRILWTARETGRDLGLGLGRPPAWARDNPFLLKAGRAETRRWGLAGRLALTVALLTALLGGGAWLEAAHGRTAAGFIGFLLGVSVPTGVFLLLAFVHASLVAGTRSGRTVPLAEEARRGTLPDLLLTPLRRAEMLLAMGVAPARSAALVALSGLPVYLLLGQLGGPTGHDIAFLFLLLALLCYAPPVWGFPVGPGAALTPDTALGRLGAAVGPTPRSNAGAAGGVYFVLGLIGAGQALPLLRGGWLGHLTGALGLHLNAGASFFLVFAWPFYAARLLGSRLPFFHADLSPLWYVLPLLLLHWAASALRSAAALSGEDAAQSERLPLASRARTLGRIVARLTAFCILGVVWRAWVESGDTATLAGFALGVRGGDAAGLLLLLGAVCLPSVCGRALGKPTSAEEPTPAQPTPAGDGDPSLLGRGEEKKGAEKKGAEKKGAASEEGAASSAPTSPPSLTGKGAGGLGLRPLRPLGAALALFLAACLAGGMSPLAAPVYGVAGKLALTAAVTFLWGRGVGRLVRGRWPRLGLLYVLPPAALLGAGAGLPGASWLAALSPVSAWLGLFPDGASLPTRFPLWHFAALPPWGVCLAGAGVVGLLAPLGLLTPALSSGRRGRSEGAEETVGAGSPRPLIAPRPPGRHADQTARLLAWVTARTDNPLFAQALRAGTRSGRWVDWGVYAPLVLLAGVILTAAYPDFVSALSFLSPLHFFHTFNGRMTSTSAARLDLASLGLAVQCWLLPLRGTALGGGLIARERQRGRWGFILATPLSSGAIFWGLVWGQAAGPGAVWALGGVLTLALYALAAPAVGVGPALAAWATGQVFAAALLALGIGVGAALAPSPVFARSGHGWASLLYAGLAALGVWGQFQILPFGPPGSTDAWRLLALRLWLGSAYGFVLAAMLLAWAARTVARLRDRDVDFGEGS